MHDAYCRTKRIARRLKHQHQVQPCGRRLAPVSFLEPHEAVVAFNLWLESGCSEPSAQNGRIIDNLIPTFKSRLSIPRCQKTWSSHLKSVLDKLLKLASDHHCLRRLQVGITPYDAAQSVLKCSYMHAHAAHCSAQVS
jgi:hypothetical protein